MVTLTPEMAGNTVILTVIMLVIALIYNIYMAIKNHQQAKVLPEIKQTNQLLLNIECLLKAQNKKLKEE